MQPGWGASAQQQHAYSITTSLQCLRLQLRNEFRIPTREHAHQQNSCQAPSSCTHDSRARMAVNQHCKAAAMHQRLAAYKKLPSVLSINHVHRAS
jgi:hypothetical protein